MGLTHLEEFKRDGTIGAWTEEEAIKEGADWSILLMFKDVHGKASIEEKVAIEINSILGYYNVDYIPKKDIIKRANEIVKLIKKQTK